MEFKTLYQEAVRTNESHEIPFKDNMPNQIMCIDQERIPSNWNENAFLNEMLICRCISVAEPLFSTIRHSPQKHKKLCNTLAGCNDDHSLSQA